MKLDIPKRSAVIEEQRASGGRVAAVFPIHYSRELLRAHGFLPVEVWGPPGVDDAAAGAHLQSYTCAIVRNGLAFLMAGGLHDVDAILVPHACDSLQGLGSVLTDFIRPEQPVLTLYPPRATRPSDLDYLERELTTLGRRLSEVSGVTPDGVGLTTALEREVEADRLLEELHQRRGQLALDDGELYRLLRSREYLPAERFTELAGAVLESAEKGGARSGVPVVLSGIVPEPMAPLFETLREVGARVVADDLACCGRRLYTAGVSDEPLRRMAQRLQSGPPDAMRGSPIAERARHLRALVRDNGAKGVIFYDVKFCEPEQFDVPALSEALKADNVPSLVIEVDLATSLPGQVTTRLEAFVEMLG